MYRISLSRRDQTLFLLEQRSCQRPAQVANSWRWRVRHRFSLVKRRQQSTYASSWNEKSHRHESCDEGREKSCRWSQGLWRMLFWLTSVYTDGCLAAATVSSVASPEFCVRGAQVWLRIKTEKNKCMPLP